MVAKPIIFTKIKIFILKYKIQDYIQDSTGKTFQCTWIWWQILRPDVKKPEE